MRAPASDALAAARRAALALLVLSPACESSEPVQATAVTPLPECTVRAPTSCPEPVVRYADVAGIFRDKCVSCHYGAAGGPWPLTTYDDAADWKDTVRDDVLDCSMPPADSGVTLSDAERLAILSWVRCGGVE
ncbi:MAG: cytochrome c [Myxococcales bacterium]